MKVACIFDDNNVHLPSFISVSIRDEFVHYNQKNTMLYGELSILCIHCSRTLPVIHRDLISIIVAPSLGTVTV